jgi:sarcosine oxidase
MQVVIIGAGIAGLSTAWALARRGHAVTLLDQGPIPNPLAASGDHHRIIRRAYGGQDGYARLITEAFDAWEAVWQDIGARHEAPVGFLCVSQHEGDEAERLVDGLARGGYPHETFGPREAAMRWPFLDPATFRSATFSNEGGALFCRSIARDLALWLEEHGARVLPHTKAIAVDADAGSVHLADGATLTADRVVICAGAWALRLMPSLADVLTTYRTAVAYFAPPPGLEAAWASAPVILDAGGDSDGYVLPPGGGGGLKFGTGWHKRKTDDPDADRIAEPGEAEAIRRYFSPPFGRIDEYRPLDVVTCCYTFTADERFLARREGRVLAVSACSGHGYKFGAAVGRRVATAIETGDDPALLSWLRAEDSAV